MYHNEDGEFILLMQPAIYFSDRLKYSALVRVFVFLSLGVKVLMEKCSIMTRYIN